MERSTLLVVDPSVAEKIDALSRDVAELKSLLQNYQPEGERSPRRLRLPEVLNRVGVSKSTWWEGIRTGRYPKGALDGRVRYWKEEEINGVVEAAG